MAPWLWLLLFLVLVAVWGGTWWRIYTGEYPGRYTRRRWLLAVLTIWGLLAYWAQGDALRTPKSAHRPSQQ